MVDRLYNLRITPFNVPRQFSCIGTINHLLVRYQTTEGMRRFRPKRRAPACFGKCRRRIVAGNNLERLTVPKVNVPEFGTADARSVLQHACKYWLKITAGAANNLQDLRRRCLLLQGFCKFTRALLLC